MQSRPMGEGASALEYYLHKNYYKTGMDALLMQKKAA